MRERDGRRVQHAADLRRPAYILRNLVYGSTTGGGLKLLDTPAGVLIYQNRFIGQGTMTGPLSNAALRSNLFVGDNWRVPVFDFRTPQRGRGGQLRLVVPSIRHAGGL